MTDADKATADNAMSSDEEPGAVADGSQGVVAGGSTSGTARASTSRTVRVSDAPNARRDTGILAAAVTAVPLVVAAGISVIPDLGGLWPTAAGIAVLAAVMVGVTVQIVRSARRLLVGQGIDADVVAYYDNRESGILLKGKIQNVALRVRTLHRIVDTLTEYVEPGIRREALYQCGWQVGTSWVDDFRRQLPTLEIDRRDILRQILKWSEYDATAGMGRLTIAVNPAIGDGVVALANSFLSRDQSKFPLNWWFAGYLAGSLSCLLNKEVRVDLQNETSAATNTTYFLVYPAQSKPRALPAGNTDPRSVARLTVWLAKLKRPLPTDDLSS